VSKKLLLTVILTTFGIFAGEHYARVEPWERVTVKAAASGLVLFADHDLEGRMAGEGLVIRIDDRLDRRDLNNTRRSERLTAKTLELTRKMLPGLRESYRRKKEYFKRINVLLTASKTQKDNAYHAMVAAENQYLSTREKELNLQKQLLDLEYKTAMLEDRIGKKNLRFQNRYLYKLTVYKGEYVTPGTPLAVVDDLSRAKAVIYLSPEERDGAEKKTVWINGRRSGAKIVKIWKETDEQYISSYRTEIRLDAKEYPFSSLVKVELK